MTADQQVRQQKALDAAWAAIGGKSQFSSSEIAWLEAMADAATATRAQPSDPAIQNALEKLESGECGPESSAALVVFLMEFCRQYHEE